MKRKSVDPTVAMYFKFIKDNHKRMFIDGSNYKWLVESSETDYKNMLDIIDIIVQMPSTNKDLVERYRQVAEFMLNEMLYAFKERENE